MSNRPIFGRPSFFREQDIAISLESNMLVLKSPYDPDFVDELKAKIPNSDRKWDKARKVWIVAPIHKTLLRKIILDHFKLNVVMPENVIVSGPVQRLLNVRYIGTVKDRGAERTAFAWDGREWSVIFPEDVLRSWFDSEKRPDEEASLYSVLSIKRDAAQDEVKAAYRRLARQWHPDVAKNEPDAAQVFIAIKHAYDILSDRNLRAKYNAGLDLQKSIGRFDDSLTMRSHQWRCPLRSGYILAEGVERVGRFVVEKIEQWEDITLPDGRTLVATWDMGRECVVEAWV